MDDTTATTEAQKPVQEIENVGVTSATASVIRNVGVLDLSGLDSPEVLDGVTSMINVGVVIVPEPLLPKLSQIPMRNVGGVRVFGGTYPAHMWQAFMADALAGQPKLDFPKDGGIITREV